MSVLGTRVVRKEDPDFLTVGGKYVDDLAPADALHATFVRSVMAHAEIRSVETADALTMPGVVAVFTATDLDISPVPPSMPMLNQGMTRSWLAGDRVRYVGEPVAVVLTQTQAQGVDAAEHVLVDYEPLEAVVSMRDSLNDETLLFPDVGTNAVFASPSTADDDFFADCDVVVSLTFQNHRLAPCPLEPRATVAKWHTDDDGTEQLTQWATTQGAHGTRDALAAAVGVDPSQVRVICPDVGGGFGAKNGRYAEDIVCTLAARKLDQPVRWAETRSESMLGLVHGRGCEFDAKLGGTRDGKFIAYQVHQVQDSGAYGEIGAVLPFLSRMVATGVYDIAKVDYFHTSTVTNTMPMGAYRGAGRPEATHAIERMVDLFAAEVGMDPAEIRRRNFVAPEAFPYTTSVGTTMDSGEYAKALDLVMEAADYPSLRAEQQRRLDDPTARLLGLGWSSYVEIANPMGNPEFGSIEITPDGSAVVLTGSSSHGQGHHTAFAQIASDMTGIPIERVEVRHGDTAEVPRGGGTGGSKSLQVGGTAVFHASENVIAHAKELAAQILEANPADIELDTTKGSFSVAGTPAITTSWADIASHSLAETEAPLKAEADFQPASATFPFGVHLSVVEVDRETGEVEAMRHIACDDAGVLVNPLIVDGQVHGGIASGIAHALVEEFAYDEDGNPLTANFMDYALVSAAELPSFERIEQETPTTVNPMGVKGVGESGTIGATPAVQNAVIDALAHLGVRHIDIPTTAQRVWNVMRDTNRTG